MTGTPPGRVFLVGCPRSGTTLLQHLLAADGRIHSLPETHFMQQLLRSEEHRRQSVARCSIGRSWQRLRYALQAHLGWVPARQARRAWAGMPGTGVRASRFGLASVAQQMAGFVEVLDRRCHAAGATLWLEKTPDHLFYLQHVHRYVAGAKVIHLLREGAEVVASLHDAAQQHADWQRFLDLDLAVDRWNLAVRESLRWQGHPQHLLLRYEQLLQQPEQVLAVVRAFLGMAQRPLARPPALQLIRADEPWKADATGPLQDRRKFERMFNPQQRRAIRAALLPLPATALPAVLA